MYDLSDFGFVVCNNFLIETKKIIKYFGGNEKNIIASDLNCKCNSPSENNYNKAVKIKDLFNNDKKNIVLFGGFCIHKLDSQYYKENRIEVYNLKNCFELLLPINIINSFVDKKNYLVSPGWLKNWKNELAAMGFKNRDIVKEFYDDTCEKILLLDTIIDINIKNDLIEFSDYINKPYEILPVGLDNYKNIIEKIILKMKLEKVENKNKNQFLETTKIRKRLVDINMVLDIILNIVNLQQENKIIYKIIELFEMLFAPQKINYYKVSNNSITDVINSNNSIGKNVNSFIQQKIKENFIWIDTEKGFAISIKYLNQIIGVVELEGFIIEKAKAEYLSLSVVLSNILGLIINNSQLYEKLTELNHQKNKFFRIISHDLRGSFNPIRGFVDILQDTCQNSSSKCAEQLEYIKNISISVDDAYKLLNNLLEWGQLQSNKIIFNPVYVNIQTLVDDIISVLSSQLKQKNISVNLNVQKNLMAFADKHMLEIVIRNLVSNSIKFTQSGGKIIIVSNNSANDNNISITVSDTGIGIPSKNIPKLFDLTSKQSTRGTNGETGTGLGLILCKNFIEKCNGKIIVSSEVGKGTNFKILLPDKNYNSK